MSEKRDVDVSVRSARRVPDENAMLPMVDVYQANDTTYLVAELPGAEEDTLDIRVDKGVLTIAAEGRLPEPAAEATAIYTAFSGGSYYRAFTLSDEVDRERISATLQDGVLTVELPRAEAARTRKIEIKN